MASYRTWENHGMNSYTVPVINYIQIHRFHLRSLEICLRIPIGVKLSQVTFEATWSKCSVGATQQNNRFQQPYERHPLGLRGHCRSGPPPQFSNRREPCRVRWPVSTNSPCAKHPQQKGILNRRIRIYLNVDFDFCTKWLQISSRLLSTIVGQLSQNFHNFLRIFHLILFSPKGEPRCVSILRWTLYWRTTVLAAARYVPFSCNNWLFFGIVFKAFRNNFMRCPSRG